MNKNFIKFNAQSFKPDPKPTKSTKPKKAYTYKRKPTGEKQIFLEIWNERPHASQISNDPISHPTPSNFLHVLPKALNKYPKLKLDKQNIVLATEQEHHFWDNQRYLIKNDPQWSFMFELEETLKQKHKILYE